MDNHQETSWMSKVGRERNETESRIVGLYQEISRLINCFWRPNYTNLPLKDIIVN
jgi:hypothetical protein